MICNRLVAISLGLKVYESKLFKVNVLKEPSVDQSAVSANDAPPAAHVFLGNKLSGLRAISLDGSRR